MRSEIVIDAHEGESAMRTSCFVRGSRWRSKSARSTSASQRSSVARSHASRCSSSGIACSCSVSSTSDPPPLEPAVDDDEDDEADASSCARRWWSSANSSVSSFTSAFLCDALSSTRIASAPLATSPASRSALDESLEVPATMPAASEATSEVPCRTICTLQDNHFQHAESCLRVEYKFAYNINHLNIQSIAGVDSTRRFDVEIDFGLSTQHNRSGLL